MKFRMMMPWLLAGAILVGGLGARAWADFITVYAWRTIVANDDLAMPATLNANNCHLKSDGTAEPCTHANFDLKFTTEGIGFNTPTGESPSLQTFAQFLNSNANGATPYPINNKVYQNGVGDGTVLDTVIFDFEGFGTFTGTPGAPQSFTFQHDDGLTFTVNNQIVVNKPDRTSPIVSVGSYTGGAGNNLPFQLIYTECCTPPAVLATSLVGPTADPNPLTLTSLNPSSAVAGGPAFLLTANGTGFVNDSVLTWNGSTRATTLINSTQLTAAISAADIAASGTSLVNVVNPAEGATSNALLFTITPGNAPSTSIQFNPTSYSAMEGAGAASIMVTRTGDTTGASSVQFASVDGTATAGKDYVGISGTLTFNSGDTSKTFDVPLINDRVADGNETVNLLLSQPTGAILGANQALLTITDQNPQPQPPPHPFISELVPYSAPVGFAQPFTMRVLGSDFASDAQVHWNFGGTDTLLSGAVVISSSEIHVTVQPARVSVAGTASVTVLNATSGLTSNTALFTIVPTGNGTPPPFVVQQPLANPNPTTTKTTQLTVLGGTFSAGGESVLTYDWEPVGTQPSGYSFSANKSHGANNMTATFSGPGVYHFNVTITDTVTKFSVLTNTLDVTVASKPASLTISPKNQTITPDQMITLRAVVKDQFGTVLTPTILWDKTAGSLAVSNTSAVLSVDPSIRSVHVTAHLADNSLSDFADITVLFGSGGVGDLSQTVPGPVPYKVTSGLPGVTFHHTNQGTRIRLYTASGKLVQTLIANSPETLWDLTNSGGDRVSSGVYFYLLDLGSQKKEGKLVIIR